MLIDLISRRLNKTFAAVVLGAALGSPLAWGASDSDEADNDQDQQILSFSTVGDSRQDPATPDPTSLPLSGQDAIWLENTKAWSRIIRSIEDQRSSLLF